MTAWHNNVSADGIPTDRPRYQRMDGQTKPLIELLCATIKFSLHVLQDAASIQRNEDVIDQPAKPPYWSENANKAEQGNHFPFDVLGLGHTERDIRNILGCPWRWTLNGVGLLISMKTDLANSCANPELSWIFLNSIEYTWILAIFAFFRNVWLTDGPTDGPMGKASYRVALCN